jgi:hypothetical protein
MSTVASRGGWKLLLRPPFLYTYDSTSVINKKLCFCGPKTRQEREWRAPEFHFMVRNWTDHPFGYPTMTPFPDDRWIAALPQGSI